MSDQYVTRHGKTLFFKKGDLSGRVVAEAKDDYDAGGIQACVNEIYDELAALREENERLKARVAELESLVRDIRQHDIDETTKRILDGGRKFNYSLPLNIRERIAAALKEPANEG